MSAKHTPSPWVVAFRKDHSAYISMGDPKVEHKQFDLAFDDRCPSDIEDARLISAAPELLGALQRVIASHDAHSTLHAPDGDDAARMVEWAEAESAARAAIAKAVQP